MRKNQSPPPGVFEFEENESMFQDSQSDFPLNQHQPWMSPGDSDSFEAVSSVPMVSSRLDEKAHHSVVQEVCSRAAPVEDWLTIINEIYKERREIKAMEKEVESMQGANFNPKINA